MHPCPQPGTPTSQFHSSVPQLQPLFSAHTVPAPGILLSAASAPSPTDQLPAPLSGFSRRWIKPWQPRCNGKQNQKKSLRGEGLREGP